MSGLLDRDPNTRIGASSWSSLTDHPFFAPLDFRLLENKQCPPVFRPSQDKSNFDAVYELEELLLEQAPLEGRVKKAAKRQHHVHQMDGLPGRDDGDDRRSKKEFPRRRGRSYEEDKEEAILEMLNEFFEPYDYTRYNDLIFVRKADDQFRYQGNPQALANLTKEIHRLSLNETAHTPDSATPIGSYGHITPGSGQSTDHESSRSVPQLPPVPTSYRFERTSPVSDSEQGYPLPQRQPTPPQSSYPLTIRPPPAVARIAGKEKKRNALSTGFLPPPTSSPSSPPKENHNKTSKMSWGKRDRESRSESKWESGVIGKERARIIIDGSHKR